MKRLGLVLMTLLLVFSASACFKDSGKSEKSTIEIKKNDVYAMPDNSTDIMTKYYNKITKELNGNNDDEKLAKLVAQSFSAEFFTLKNKDGASDVGGVTYIVPSDQETFLDYASNYVYANYEAISDDYGSASLPEVSKVSVEDIALVSYTYPLLIPADEASGTAAYTSDTLFDAYKVDVNITYKDTKVSEDDLKKNATIYIIKVDGRICVAEIA